MAVNDRYTANVGDRDPTWRYLLEKVGHTALILLGLFALAGVPLVRAAVCATLIYLVIGKVAWVLATKRAGKSIDVWLELRDSTFDGLLGAAVIAIAGGHASRAVGWLALAGVLAVCAILFNNRWSSPGNLG